MSQILGPSAIKCHAKAQLMVLQYFEAKSSICLLHLTLQRNLCDKRKSVIFPTTYRSRLPGEQPTMLISGLVSNISLGLNISNQRDDAFQAVLSFSLPSTLLEFVRVEPRSVSDQFNNPSCIPTLSRSSILSCNNIPPGCYLCSQRNLPSSLFSVTQYLYTHLHLFHNCTHSFLPFSSLPPSLPPFLPPSLPHSLLPSLPPSFLPPFFPTSSFPFITHLNVLWKAILH